MMQITGVLMISALLLGGGAGGDALILLESTGKAGLFRPPLAVILAIRYLYGTKVHLAKNTVPTHLLHMIRTLGRALAQRALHACKALAQKKGVNLRGAYIGVSQQGLHSANVTAALKQFVGKTLAEGEATGRFAQRVLARRVVNGAMNGADMYRVVDSITVRIQTNPARAQQPLPLQTAIGLRVLLLKGKGQRHGCFKELLLALPARKNRLNALAQPFTQRGGQQGSAVFGSFAVAYGNHLVSNVDVPNPQARGLHHTQACAVLQ